MADLPNQTGRAWLAAFMDAQARVASNTLWLPFAIGQLGVAQEHDPASARAMLEQMKVDRRDLTEALEHLDGVMADMIANAERNMAKKKR